MISIKWQQVNAWRLSQQNLTHRLKPDNLIQTVRQSMGVHAQNMLAAELAIAARVDELSPQDIQAALWQDRILIKTWMMRQTLHLIPAADFPIYTAARQLTDLNWPLHFERYGINRATLDAYLAIAPEVLNNEPLTRQQFVKAVVERLKSPELRDLLAKGSWGIAFKPLAWRGELCFGPNVGQNTTFIRPSAWIGPWEPMEPEKGMQEIVRRYLLAYGPSNPQNFQWWWWTTLSAAKKAFSSIADETDEVDVEGWRSTALRSTIKSIQEMKPTGTVHLLPSFDAYTMGIRHRKSLTWLISLEDQKKVYRMQGWVSAVVVVDGYIHGIWEHKIQRNQTMILISLFQPASRAICEGIAAEAERIGKFLNTKVVLEYKNI